MLYVIVVNGYPRAGKDTFVQFCEQQAERIGLKTRAFSSIDPVRNMLLNAGVSIWKKRPEDRKLLAVVGDALEEHSEWRSRTSAEAITDFRHKLYTATSEAHGLFFLHVREPETLARIKKHVEARRIPVRWIIVMVELDRAEAPATTADRRVRDMAAQADYTVKNDGTIVEVRDKAISFLQWLGVYPGEEKAKK